jgi:hypothetical protein
MRVCRTMSAAARRRPGTGLPYLVMSGLLWGTGGLTGSLLSRTAGLSAISVAAYRLTIGGVLIVAFLAATGRRRPAGRAAWTRIAAVGLLAALYQGCYFTAVSLTSVPLATLVTIGTAPVIVLGAERVTGRQTGKLAVAAAGLALIGLGLLVGLPSGFSQTAVLASAGMAVLAAAGFAAVTLTGSRPVPGLDEAAVTGFGFTARRPGPDAAGGGVRRPRLPARSRRPRPAPGPGYRSDRRGVHAVFPRPADRGRQHGRASGPAGTPDRNHPVRLHLGGAAERAGIAGAAILALAVILTVRAGRAGSMGGAGRVGSHDRTALLTTGE